MIDQSGSGAISPEKAQLWLESWRKQPVIVPPAVSALAFTVATEPERIAEAERAAVVKALRNAVTKAYEVSSYDPDGLVGVVDDYADAVENGADW